MRPPRALLSTRSGALTSTPITRRSTSSRRALLSFAVLLTALVGCDAGTVEPLTRLPVESPSSTKTRIIGLVGSLSGPDSWRGDDAFEGADLAVQELNRALGPKDPMYELVTLDDRGDAAEATRLVKQLAGSDRTVGIVYAGPPEGLPPAEEALAAGGVPAILCYGDLYGARLLSPHVFQASPSFLWEARRIARYLLDDRGYRRIGLVSERNLSGQSARRSVTLALQEMGASLRAAVTFEPEVQDFGPVVRELKKERVQAVILEATPPEAVRFLQATRLAGSRYRSTAAALASARRGRPFRPQVVGLDLMIHPSLAVELSPGVVASDTYSRGAHYLPIPNIADFRTAFEDWWGSQPLGWERRAYDSVHMLGWAVRRTRGNASRVDLAPFLERIRGLRFGGLDITLGPDDHTTVDQTTVGLWVVPRPGADVPEADELPEQMPWVPLARGFSIDGERTDILPEDWRWMFRNAPPKKAPAPFITRSLFGVTTPAGDPIH